MPDLLQNLFFVFEVRNLTTCFSLSQGVKQRTCDVNLLITTCGVTCKLRMRLMSHIDRLLDDNISQQTKTKQICFNFQT